MHVSVLVDFAGIKQNTLGSGCFPCVDVSDDADIPHVREM
jgi:hypothetical protein